MRAPTSRDVLKINWLIVAVLIGMLAASGVSEIRRDYLSEMQRQARVVEDALINADASINRALLGVDSLLSGLPNLLCAVMGKTQGSSPESQESLKALVSQNLLVGDLMIVDRDGKEIVASASTGRKRMLIAPEFLQRMEKERVPRLFVGAPVVSARTGEWVLHMARPIVLTGLGAAVAVAEVSVHNFVTSLARSAVSEGFVMTVENDEGRILASVPFNSLLYESNVAMPPLAGQDASGQARIGRHRVTGDEALVAYHPTLYRPIVAVASLSLAPATKDWREGSLIIAVSIAIIALFVVVIGAAVHVYVLERERAMARLAEAKQAAEEASTSKSRFLANMSHELRTPLNAILGFGQALEISKKEPLAPTQKEYLEYILKSGHHLLNMINQILDLARVESGALPLRIESVAVCSIIEDIAALMAPLAANKNLDFVKDIAVEPSVMVAADETGLKQVLFNLLSNAMKYNVQDGKCTVRCKLTDNGRCRIDVIDTGIGIPAELQKDLFRPFNRLGLEGMAVEGTGIGLALAHNMVRLMGGELRCISEPGRGSIFWFDLPLAKSKPAGQNLAQ